MQHETLHSRKLNSKLNDLPLTLKTYDELCKVCTFGTEPIGGKVVVRRMSDGYNTQRYAIVSNPIGLDVEHIAFFADHGNLCFGFRNEGPFISVYID